MPASTFREMLGAPRVPPPLPSRKKAMTPSADARQVGCTHQQVTRLYDEYGASTCSLCHRHPSLGWLYRCTQDSGGFLPRSDFSNESQPKYNRPVLAPSLRYLSPSIMKAMNDGQYTDDQIEELVRQKESVRQAMYADTRPTTASTTSQDSTTFSTIPESTSFSTATSASLDDELRAAYDWQALHQAWQAVAPREGNRDQHNSIPETDTPTIVTVCGLKVCATCRPTYRERASQSLDEVVLNPKWPPPWELENRRVSDVDVVKKIYLKAPMRFDGQPHGPDTESRNTFLSQYTSTLDEAHLDDGIANGTDSKRHSRSGFRETVRNALKRARSGEIPKMEAEDSSATKNGTNTDSTTPFRRSMIFMRRKSRTSLLVDNGATSKVVSNRIVGNDSLQNSLNLMLASNTPLPPSGPSTPLYPVFHHQDEADTQYQPQPSFTDIIAHA